MTINLRNLFLEITFVRSFVFVFVLWLSARLKRDLLENYEEEIGISLGFL